MSSSFARVLSIPCENVCVSVCICVYVCMYVYFCIYKSDTKLKQVNVRHSQLLVQRVALGIVRGAELP